MGTCAIQGTAASASQALTSPLDPSLLEVLSG
jgi:hypothetical protein